MIRDLQRTTILLSLVLLFGALLAACGSGDGDPEQPTPASTASSGVEHATATPASADVELAPELVGLGEWINSEPLTLAQLRGEPVLLVFWASW